MPDTSSPVVLPPRGTFYQIRKNLAVRLTVTTCARDKHQSCGNRPGVPTKKDDLQSCRLFTIMTSFTSST